MSVYSSFVILLGDARDSSFVEFSQYSETFGIKYCGSFSRYTALEEGDLLEEEHNEDISLNDFCSAVQNRGPSYISIWEGEECSFELGLYKHDNNHYMIVHFSNGELVDLGYELKNANNDSLNYLTKLFITSSGTSAIFSTDKSFVASSDYLTDNEKNKNIEYIGIIMERNKKLIDIDKFDIKRSVNGILVAANYFPGFNV